MAILHKSHKHVVGKPLCFRGLQVSVFQFYLNIGCLRKNVRCGWRMGIKVAFIKSQIARNCHKITNCEQFRTKCSAKIAAIWTLASTDVFLIKMWQESYDRRESWVFEKKFFRKWVEILWHQVIIIYNRRSLLYQ